MKKSNNIIMVILIIMVLALTGYIVYDKALSTNKNNELTENKNNDNNNDKNNDNNNDNTTDIYDLKTIKTYAGCSKELYQSSLVSFQYAKYVLEIKEENKCVLYYGGVDSSSNGSIMLPFNCDTANSYITVTNSEIPMFFKVNSNDTITYQNANIIMRKVDSPQDANYNFCKNNY